MKGLSRSDPNQGLPAFSWGRPLLGHLPSFPHTAGPQTLSSQRSANPALLHPATSSPGRGLRVGRQSHSSRFGEFTSVVRGLEKPAILPSGPRQPRPASSLTSAGTEASLSGHKVTALEREYQSLGVRKPLQRGACSNVPAAGKGLD